MQIEREKPAMDDTGHWWSGFPRCYCMYCLESHPLELESAGISVEDDECTPECPENKRI